MTHHAHLQQWNSRPQPSGAWSPVTASIDWCEQNYEYSYWVAEFWNTFSNLVFLSYAAFVTRKTMSEQLGLRQVLLAASLMAVAIGSFAFHMTLKYTFQLADEIPMLITATQNLYVLFSTSKSKDGLLLPSFLYTVVSIIVYAYVSLGNPVFHQVAYAILLLSGVGRATYLMQTRLNNTPYERIRKRDIRRITGRGTIIFILGFIIWNLDNLFCNAAQKYKDRLGFWSVLLEGHALWHYLTGIGGVYLTVGCQMLALSLREGADHFEFRWKLAVPYIVRQNKIRKDQ